MMTLCQRGVVVPFLLLLVVLTDAAPAPALPILPVSGTIRSGSGGSFWTVELTGARGFSMHGFFVGGAEGTYWPSFLVPQGSPIDLGMGALVIHGRMTVEGRTYSTDGSCGFPPHTTIPCGVAGPLFVHAPTIAPITSPPVTGQLVTIATPITNTVLMSLAFSDREAVNLVLAGPGQAVVTLRDFGSGERYGRGARWGGASVSQTETRSWINGVDPGRNPLSILLQSVRSRVRRAW